MTKLTKRFAFSASHRLHVGALSEEQNRELFGKCANPFGHGHNYWLEVTVSAPPDDQSGMTLERGAFEQWVRDCVLERIDHTYLNEDVQEFRETVPTTENLTLAIERWLREGWSRRFPDEPCLLAGVRVEETSRNSFQLS